MVQLSVLAYEVSRPFQSKSTSINAFGLFRSETVQNILFYPPAEDIIDFSAAQCFGLLADEAAMYCIEAV